MPNPPKSPYVMYIGSILGINEEEINAIASKTPPRAISRGNPKRFES